MGGGVKESMTTSRAKSRRHSIDGRTPASGPVRARDHKKLEAKKLRKGKNNAEEDLDSLKTYYKKLRSSMRTAELGKMSEQWRQEIQEEKIRADRWEKKFQDA
ncbi:hypothetical protein Gohar_000042 [Gossypium harknessii]|uniref:Uncharacterized protein n=1 Tax=Gossypium harknessii TaxID=34285 RepID=A0A7J9IA24_9ROSI|nr:hypothetical protein [Gossypium harknessii]